MPIDVAGLKAAELEELATTWREDDVILYHLGLGAGVPPDDERELAYVYEPDLKVLPAFGVIPAQGALLSLMSCPSFDVPLNRILHAEQELELRQPLAPSGVVRTSARVAAVYDKGEGRAAIVVLEAVTSDDAGRELCVNRFSIYARGEGGCGGDDPPSAPEGLPARDPDMNVAAPTFSQQGLLYRMSGDKNPLHADPAFARRAGFDRPILHGLCSYGVVLKAIVEAALDGDVASVARYRARFAGVAYPGETLAVDLWREDGRVWARAHAAERRAPVLSDVVVDVR